MHSDVCIKYVLEVSFYTLVLVALKREVFVADLSFCSMIIEKLDEIN